MNFIRNNFKYIFLFIFFVIILLFICFENTSFDFIWSYGFSHAIRIGEIPYLEFNTISTPLYIFIMSLFLFIKDSFFVFVLVQALFCTILFYVIFKYIGKKGWLLLPVLAFPFFVSFIGTYNFLTFFLLVFLFYLEDNNKSDYLLGFILGLLILSKQTIGGMALVLNFVFLKDLVRIKKRIIGASIPLVIFLLFLVFTGSLYSFIDLCFLGLFDFGKSNGGIKVFTIISVLMLALVVVYYVRNKDIKCSYLMASFFFPFPIFDYSHFNLYLALFILFFMSKIEFDEKKIVYSSFCLLITILLLNIFIKFDFYKELVFSKFNHFEYYLLKEKDEKKFQKISAKYNSYPDAIMIDTQAMFYDIISDRKIAYFDMPLSGNYGLKGTNGMIDKVSNMHDQMIFINICNYDDLKDTTQFDYELVKYVIENSKKIDKVLCYNIYYKE